MPAPVPPLLTPLLSLFPYDIRFSPLWPFRALKALCVPDPLHSAAPGDATPAGMHVQGGLTERVAPHLFQVLPCSALGGLRRRWRHATRWGRAPI